MWAFFRCQGIGSTGLTSAVAGDIRCHRTVKARCAAIRASAQGSRQACGGLDHRLYGIEPGGFNEMLRKASGACGFEGSVIATSSILNGATLKGPCSAAPKTKIWYYILSWVSTVWVPIGVPRTITWLPTDPICTPRDLYRLYGCVSQGNVFGPQAKYPYLAPMGWRRVENRKKSHAPLRSDAPDRC